jgi:hypothetical protein
MNSMAMRRLGGAVVALTLACAAGVATADSASAVTTTPLVMATTQRMTGPHLTNFLQEGTYSAGSQVSLYCYAYGQAVKGYYSPWITGGYDSLWYQNTDGHWVADVDINTGSNNPVTQPCAASVDTNQWFEIVSKRSTLVLDIAGGATSNGARLQQYARNNTISQRFRLVATSGGYYRVIPRTNQTQAWDVAGLGTANGTKMQVWGYVDGGNQQFTVTKMAGGGFRFTPRHATNRCVDVPGGSLSSGVQLQIYQCNSTASQTFDMYPKGQVSAVRVLGSGVCDYMKSGGNYVRGDGRELGTYTLAGWRVPVCGPRPNFDNGLVGAAGKGVDPFGGEPDIYDLDGYQCTELAARWLYLAYGAKYANAAGNYSGGNGVNVVSNYAARFPDLFLALSDARTAPPRAGDVMSFYTGDAFGHVGLVYSVAIDTSGNGSVQILEQNSNRTGGTTGMSTYPVSSWHIQSAKNWLRRR